MLTENTIGGMETPDWTIEIFKDKSGNFYALSTDRSSGSGSFEFCTDTYTTKLEAVFEALGKLCDK